MANNTRPNKTECIDMWEESNNAKEYEALYDKAMAHNTGENKNMDTQKMICMRCGAWDDKTNRPDDARCGVNCFLLTKGKTQGFNCKLQRYNKNRTRKI